MPNALHSCGIHNKPEVNLRSHLKSYLLLWFYEIFLSRSILHQLENISWNWRSLNIINSIEIFWPHCTSAHCTRARCFHTLESFACWNFWKNVSRERSCLVLSSSSENMLFDPIQCCYMYVFVFFLPIALHACYMYMLYMYMYVYLLLHITLLECPKHI